MSKAKLKNINSDSVRDATSLILSKISPLDRIILYMRIENGYTLKQMSDLLSLSYETIRLRLNKTYDLILKTLKKERNKKRKGEPNENEVCKRTGFV